MVEGSLVRLRLVDEEDIPLLHRYIGDPENRGPYFPVHVRSFAELFRRYHSDGFWRPDDGTLIIEVEETGVVGWIRFFRPHPVYDALEIEYILFEKGSRGNGYCTEALSLCVEFLFSTMEVPRLELNIGEDNLASCRVAEKCGFVREGVLRSVWYSPQLCTRINGIRYSLLRDEWVTAYRPRGLKC